MFSGVIIWNGRKLLSICNNKNANRQIYTKFSGLANGRPYPDVACRCRDDYMLFIILSMILSLVR